MDSFAPGRDIRSKVRACCMRVINRFVRIAKIFLTALGLTTLFFASSKASPAPGAPEANVPSIEQRVLTIRDRIAKERAGGGEQGPGDPKEHTNQWANWPNWNNWGNWPNWNNWGNWGNWGNWFNR